MRYLLALARPVWYNIGRMMQEPQTIPEALEAPQSAVERAIEFGVDITLLIENLRLTPTERVQKAQRFLDSIVSLQAEVKAWRNRQAR